MRKYRVNGFEGDSLEPEESLLEAVSPDSRIEKPVPSEFFFAFYFVVLAALALFIAAGFNLGILKSVHFAQLSSQNQFISVPLLQGRGLVYSKEGSVLADNKETENLWFISARLNSGQKDEQINKLSEILELPADSVSELIDKNSSRASFLIKEDISQDEKDKILALNYPDLFVVKSTDRIYPEKKTLSHLIGYVGLVNEEDLKKDDSYKISSRRGRSGIESFYEPYLRGGEGELLVNRFSDEARVNQPKKGSDVVLNIDLELQKNIFSELESGTRSIGKSSAAAVALDPRDGRVLALVSLPSYDANSLTSGLNQEEYKLFFENPKNPLLNRVISGKFSPGSTIKPLVALAALEEGIISPSKKINAPGFITIQSPYDPEIIYTFRDWKNHGWVSMREAIAQSSDIYFYTVGGGFYDVKGLGIERLAEYLKKFKLDSALGIDLNGEVAGFVPTPDWKIKTRGETWYQGDTFNVSIGQGDLLITPLWLANFTAALANEKFLYRPFIADKVLDEDGNVVKKMEPEILEEFSFDPENLKVVKEGMALAAKIGTAKVLANLPVKVGAKSGTAEVIKGQSTTSWITLFAPYDNPQIVLTIMMESGREGSYIPHEIAYRILKTYFENSF